MSEPPEFVPPFLSPLTHDEHARLGRISILWGQIDLILDELIEIALSITSKQRQTLIGEKPLGAKLDILGGHLDDIQNAEAKENARRFWTLANETKSQRNRCFHGVWGWRCSDSKIDVAAGHYKAGNDPVRSTQLPALEKKLCKTARVGFTALAQLDLFPPNKGAVRLFHGLKSSPPAWLEQWIEQHPVDDHSLDHRWKLGWLPFLKKPH